MLARIPASAALIAACCLALFAPLAQVAHAGGKMVTASYLVADLVIPVENFGTAQTTPLPPNGSGNNVSYAQTSSLEYTTTLLGEPQVVQPCPTLTQCCASRSMPSCNGQVTRKPLKYTQERLLIDLITKTIAPGSWSGSGGQGTIDYHPLTMALVINQTHEVHDQIQDLLASLQRMQDVQVALEVRYMDVSEDAWKSIQQKVKMSSCPTQHPEEITFLKDKEAALLLETMQNHRGTAVVQAPKATLFNGQTGTICCEETHHFTTGLDVDLTSGQIQVVPVHQDIPTGLRITMQPVVSADRRFVRVSLKSELTGLLSSEVALVPVTVASKDQENKPISVTHHIQQPKVNTLTCENTVAIPDGGTVCISGLKKVCEARNEFGPPVLSDIPYLNRLFKNVGYSREERRVLTLVTARVIVNEEPAYQTGHVQGLHPSPAQCDTAPAACSDAEEQEPPAKPEKLGRQEKVVSDLLKAYDEACDEGRKAEAKKLARAALAIDPTCFRGRR
jgi:type II secretory pathway component GspD/PulD (secretin)